MKANVRKIKALPLSLFLTLRALPLGLVLVLITGIILLANFRTILSSAHQNQFIAHAEKLNSALDDRLNTVIAQLQHVANSQFLRDSLQNDNNPTTDSLSHYLQSLSPSDLNNLPMALTDAQGLILHGTQSATELVHNKAWQEGVLRKKEITAVWTDTSLVIGIPLINIPTTGPTHSSSSDQASADQANAQITGALIAQLDSMHFEQLFSILPTSPQFLVIDYQEKILLSTQPTVFLPGDSFAQPVESSIWMFNKAVPLPAYNGQLVTFSKKVNTTPLTEKLSIIIALALTTVFITMLGTIFISGRIVTQSITTLTNTMTELMQCQNSILNARASMHQHAPKELLELASAFNTLLDKLSSSTTSRQEMTSILRSLSEILIVTDHDGVILWSNAAYESFMHDTDQRVARTFLEHGDWHPAELNTQNGGLEITYHRAIDKINKTGMTILWSRTLYFNEANEHKGYIYTGQNVTKTRQTEQALKLEQRNLEAARIEADQASLAKSNFLASMSHEIRTPMNGVLGMIGLLLKSQLTTRQRTQAYLVESSARSLLALINDILDFSKIEANTLDLANRPFDLINTITECAQTLALSAFEKGVELVLDLNGIDQRKLRGDHTRLRQVITNLASNAIKFTDRGHVIIRATLTPPHNGERQLTINVEDTGIGIPQEALPNLFEAFHQRDNSAAREHGGSGLGLAIVQRLTHLMGGEIVVSSTVGKGSTFTASLKLGSNLPYESAHPKRILTEYNVLVADNVNASLSATRNALEILGAEVFSSLSLEHTLAHCKEQESPTPFDLLFIDERLSTPDNFELIDQIKPFLKTTHQGMIPIVYLGDITQELDENTTHQNRNYVLKPILPEMLETICTIVLEGSDDVPPEQMLIPSHALPPEDTLHQVLPATPNTLRPPPPIAPNTDLLTGIAMKPAPEAEKPTLKILLVEDNKINQEVAVGVLEEFNLATEIANDGQEAIDLLTHAEQSGRPFHLVLMDCQMPRLDGYAATRAIRAGQAGTVTKGIPIIAMTANAMLGDKEKCMAAGMNDYLTKPLEPEALIQALSQWSGKEI